MLRQLCKTRKLIETLANELHSIASLIVMSRSVSFKGSRLQSFRYVYEERALPEQILLKLRDRLLMPALHCAFLFDNTRDLKTLGLDTRDHDVEPAALGMGHREAEHIVPNNMLRPHLQSPPRLGYLGELLFALDHFLLEKTIALNRSLQRLDIDIALFKDVLSNELGRLVDRLERD